MPSHKFFDRFILLGGSNVDLDELNSKLNKLETFMNEFERMGFMDNNSNSEIPLDKFVKRSQVADTLNISKEVKDNTIVNEMYGIDLITVDGKYYINGDIMLKLINALYVDVSELKESKCKVR